MTAGQDKASQEWGADFADRLWRGLYARWSPMIDDRVVLDLGCNWGYLLKHLHDHHRPRRLIGVDLHPLWRTMEHEWDYESLDDVEFHEGVLADLHVVSPGSVDVILSTSTLQYMGPEELERNLRCCYDLLRPGGEMLLRTRVSTSYIGADLHADFELPYAHLIHRGPDLESVLAERGRRLKSLSPWTSAAYLAAFARAGFEVVDATRRSGSDRAEFEARVAQAVPGVAGDERRAGELEARLVRALDPAEMLALRT